MENNDITNRSLSQLDEVCAAKLEEFKTAFSNILYYKKNMGLANQADEEIIAAIMQNRLSIDFNVNKKCMMPRVVGIENIDAMQINIH